MAGPNPNPSLKKKTKTIETGLGLGHRPNQPNFLWAKGVFGKTHHYAISL